MIKKIVRAIDDSINGKNPSNIKRSSRWDHVREEHLKDNPNCALCGGNESLEVHHIRPFHLHLELELDPSNLITLCESKKNGIVCHLFMGHLGNYKSFNENVKEDVLLWRDRIANRPKSE